MTAAALLALVWFFLLTVRQVQRLRHAAELVRQAGSVQGADDQLARATRLGLINPPAPRRWSTDRQSRDDVVPRVLHDMPHS